MRYKKTAAEKKRDVIWRQIRYCVGQGMTHALTADNLNRIGIEPMRKDKWEPRDVEQYIRRMRSKGRRVKPYKQRVTEPTKKPSATRANADLLVAVVNSDIDNDSKMALTQIIVDLVSKGEA